MIPGFLPGYFVTIGHVLKVVIWLVVIGLFAWSLRDARKRRSPWAVNSKMTNSQRRNLGARRIG